MRRLLFALVFGVGAMFATAGDARAQFITQRDGSLAIPNGNGTFTIIHPSRLAPGAEYVVPGSVQTNPGRLL
jgi:hypothetical protein